MKRSQPAQRYSQLATIASIALMSLTLSGLQGVSALSKTYICFFNMGDAHVNLRCSKVIHEAFGDWRRLGGTTQAQNDVTSHYVPKIAVLGLAQDPGYPEGDDRLSMLRALSVLQKLEELGVPKSLSMSSSYGAKYPLVASSTSDPQNRRVEIQIR